MELDIAILKQVLTINFKKYELINFMHFDEEI
jgi:hypothetical protein